MKVEIDLKSRFHCIPLYKNTKFLKSAVLKLAVLKSAVLKSTYFRRFGYLNFLAGFCEDSVFQCKTFDSSKLKKIKTKTKTKTPHFSNRKFSL